MATVDVDVQQLLIGGRWVGASSGRSFEKTNPFTGEAAGSAAAAGREDARAAVEAANEAIRLAAPLNRGMSPRQPGHLPLSMTDPATGIRFGLRVARRGVDSVIVGTGPVPFAHDVGRAGQDELLMFLDAHRGRCSPNVFAPIFLFRAGVSGILNGRGAIRYSLVLANVMERLFDLSHPPIFSVRARPAWRTPSPWRAPRPEPRLLTSSPRCCLVCSRSGPRPFAAKSPRCG